MSRGSLSKYRRKTKNKKSENNIILIVCGGETEVKYFKKFNINLGEIKIKTVINNKSPMYLVNEAIRLNKDNEYIQVWCVFDKDEFDDFDNAIYKASQNKILVAYSNQAFELWFILHFERKNGLIHRSKYTAILNKYLDVEYKKAEEKIYDVIKSNMGQAIQNAKWGHQTNKIYGNKPSDYESCTTVYILVEELLKWKK